MSAGRVDTWMPLFIRDYYADTQHLSAERHGIYMLLIMAYWMTGRPLPDDDEHLGALAKQSPADWARHRPIIAAFFRVGGGEWRHKRVDQELARAADVMEQRQAAGKASAKRRRPSTEAQREAQREGNVRTNETPNETATKTETTTANTLHSEDRDIPSPTAARARAEPPLLQDLNLGDEGDGGDSDSGNWDSQQKRDAFAQNRIAEKLAYDGHRAPWELLLKAEDETHPEYEMACRRVRAAAKAAGVGWISPHLRKGRAA